MAGVAGTQPDTGAGAWLLQEEGGRWAGWLSNNSRLQIRGQGVLVAAGTEGLSACTASSETYKLSGGCCLEGICKRSLSWGNFWLRSHSKKEKWVKWEDLEELGTYTESFLGQVRLAMLLIAVCF